MQQPTRRGGRSVEQAGTASYSRRRLLQTAAAGVATTVALALLAACGGGTTAQSASTAAVPTSSQAAASATSAAVTTPAASTTSNAATTSAGAATATAATSAPAGAAVSVMWMTRQGDTENKWEKDVAIPGFEKAHLDIKVEWVNVAWADYFPKQMTMQAGGTPPDLWVPYGSTGSRGYEAVGGMVRDLTPFVQRDKLDMTVIPKSVLDFFTVGGHLVAMPYMTVGSFIFYNKELFQKAGVPLPPVSWDDKSWTLDAFMSAAHKLTNKPGQPDAQYGVNGGDMGDGMGAWLWQADPWSADGYTTGYPSKVTFDSPEVQTAYNFFADLELKEHVAPTAADTKAMALSTAAFVLQRQAMVWTGGWGLWAYNTTAKFNWGVAPFPWAKANTDPIWPDAYLMAAKSKFPDQTWTLLTYLTGAEGMQGYMEATGSPPANQSLLDQWYKTYKVLPVAELKPAHEGSIKYGRIPPPHAFVDINHIGDVLNPILSPMWQGKTPVLTALQSAQTTVTAALAPNVGKKICFSGESTGVC